MPARPPSSSVWMHHTPAALTQIRNGNGKDGAAPGKTKVEGSSGERGRCDDEEGEQKMRT